MPNTLFFTVYKELIFLKNDIPKYNKLVSFQYYEEILLIELNTIYLASV